MSGKKWKLCKKGHPLTESNIVLKWGKDWPDGPRECRICKYERNRKLRKR